MRNLSSVVWSEGMQLVPHHFQAQNRYFENSIHFVTSALWPDSYGLAGIELDANALLNGTISLIHARGLFPDGLAFTMPEADALPEPRSAPDLFPPLRPTLDVFLSVPLLRENEPNCAALEAARHDGIRYIEDPQPVRDENTGRDEEPLTIGRKNIRLTVDTEETTGLASIPIARIRREGTGRFAYDPDFIPPALNITTSPALMAMLHRMIAILENKTTTIARPKDLASGTVTGFSVEGIANAWFLHCVNSTLPLLRNLVTVKRAHPRELYAELARFAGALCTFALDSHPMTLPLYDHAHLDEVFGALDHHIRTHLELIVPSNCLEIPLERTGECFWSGRIEDQRTLGQSRWVLAVRARVGEADLIASAPRLIKICSREYLPKLVKRALPGLKLVHLISPPPALSPKVEVQYFGISKAGPCWDHMVETRELSVYVPEEIPEPEVQVLVIFGS